MTGGLPGWSARVLLGPAALCVLSACSAVLAVLSGRLASGSGLPNQHAAFLLSVTGLSSWLPLCGLICLRSYLRRGWNFSIPLTAFVALIVSALVTWHAWNACSSPLLGFAGCW